MKDQQVFIYCQDGEDESNEKNRKECGPNFQGVSITQGKQIEVLDHFRRRKQRSNKHPDRWCIYNHMQKRWYTSGFFANNYDTRRKLQPNLIKPPFPRINVVP